MNSRTLLTLKRLSEQIQSRLDEPGCPKPMLLGIGGPGGCGKSTVARWLLQRFPDSAELPLDDYRLPRAHRAKTGRFGSHPEGNDLPRLYNDLLKARDGHSIDRPVFDSIAGASVGTQRIDPASLIICDGEIAAHDQFERHFDLLIIVDAHWRTQLNTRLARDVSERGYNLEKAIEVFLQSNLRDYPRFAASARARADFLLYRAARNELTLKRGPHPSRGRSNPTE